MTAKTNNERQKAYDERQRALGRVQHRVWATPEEHGKIKAFLLKLRAKFDKKEGA